MKDAARRAGRWLVAHPFVVCLLWALWLSALYGVFGPHSYVRIFDNADGLLPSRSGMNLSIAGWDALASWAHSWASGVDHGTVELDAIPFLVLPGWLAYWLIMFGQRLLAAYFGYRLARDRWGTSRGGAWFLALCYSAFQQPYINDSWAGWTLYDGLALAAVPAVVWLLLAPDVSRRRLLLFAAGAGILYAWTSNYPFSAFVIVLLPVVLFASGGRGPNKWLAFGVFVVAWVVAELPAVLYGLLNSAASHRADRVAFSPLTVPFSQRFGQLSIALGLVRENIVGLGLGIVAAVRFKDRRAFVLVAASAAVTLAVAFAQKGDAALDAYGGPLANFTFQRFYFWFPFLAASAGAFGVDSLKVLGVRAARLVAFAAIAIVVVMSMKVNVQMAATMVSGSNYAAVLEDPALVALGLESRQRAPFRVATVVSSAPGFAPPQPSFAWAHNIDTVDGYLNMYAQRYQDFWERVIGPLAARDVKRYDYYHYWGNRIYLFQPTEGFPPGPVQIKDYYDLDLLALANVRYLISGTELSDARLREVSRPVPKPTPPQRVLQSWRAIPSWWSELTGAVPTSSVYVYELQGTLPRAFIVSSVRSFPTRNALLDALAAASPDELRNTAFVEQADGVVSIPESGVAEAGPVRRSPDRLEIPVESTTPALMVVTVQYSRFWTAEVDGGSVRVTSADGPFMAVSVPSGHHTVVMRYDPPYGLPFVP